MNLEPRLEPPTRLGSVAGRYPLDKKEPTMVCVGGRVDHLVQSPEATFKLKGLLYRVV